MFPYLAPRCLGCWTRCPIPYGIILFLLFVLVGNSNPLRGQSSSSANFEAFRQQETKLRAMLAAIDAGRLGKNDLGVCLRRLTQLYRGQGLHEGSARFGTRHHQYLQSLKPVPHQALRESAMGLGMDFHALGDVDQAEKYFIQALGDDNAKGPPLSPLLRLQTLIHLAKIAESQKNVDKAQQHWKTVLAEADRAINLVKKGVLPRQQVVMCLQAKAMASLGSGQNPDAGLKLARSLAKQLEPQSASAARDTRLEIALYYLERDQPHDAETLLRDALSAQEKVKGDLFSEAELRAKLAATLLLQSKRDQAKKQLDQALEQFDDFVHAVEKQNPNDQRLGTALLRMRKLHHEMGQLVPCARAAEKLLKFRQQTVGANHPLTIDAKSAVAVIWGELGFFGQSKPYMEDVLKARLADQQTQPLPLAVALNNLASLERATGSITRAKTLFEKALSLRKKHLDPGDPSLAASYNNLASIFVSQGRYTQAIELYQSALKVLENPTRPNEALRSTTLLNLAVAYKSQGQYEQAGQFCQQALDVRKKALGQESLGLVSHYNAVAHLYILQRTKLDDAKNLAQQVLTICDKHHQSKNPAVGTAHHLLALIAHLSNDAKQAEVHWKNALSVHQEHGQPDRQIRTLNYLAVMVSKRGAIDEGMKLSRQALQLIDQYHALPQDHFVTRSNFAKMLWAKGQKDAAREHLQKAIEIVEAPRAFTAGAEEQRAAFFADFASAFDLLVHWNIQAGEVEKAFGVAERARSRTILEELQLAGVDLRDTLQGAQGKALVSREKELRAELAKLTHQAQQLTDPKSSEAQALAQQLNSTQKQFRKIWNDIRGASPFYRRLLSQQQRLAELMDIQKELGPDQLALFYYLGKENSYVFALTGKPAQLKAFALTVPKKISNDFSKALTAISRHRPLDERGLVGIVTSPDQSPEMKVEIPEGPLTRALATQLVSHSLAVMRSKDFRQTRGLVGVVTSPDLPGSIIDHRPTEAPKRGLAHVLLPDELRNLIQKQSPKQLVVVPDGALHHLPFEALILEPGPEPKYVMDELPAFSYTPSLNVWVNLRQRPRTLVEKMKVVSVGNPAYSTVESTQSQALELASRQAFLRLGGQLPRLPGTSRECQRLAKAFPAGTVRVFESDQATEKNVVDALAGARYVHLAAHGLVDHSHGNLFGAIALSPNTSRKEDDQTDGFLHYYEIHQLPLQACELAALSACQTNVGPNRPMESGVSLAHAFLTAGARRVVASHWSVSDASTAELMGLFFEEIAKNEATNQPVPFAQALQRARQKIRQNPRWKAPYYWAPFVLIGPN